MRIRSIRRFLLWTLLPAVVLGAGAGAVWTYLNASHEVEELFDAELAQSARVLAGLTSREMLDDHAQDLADALARSGMFSAGDDDASPLGHPYETKLMNHVTVTWANGRVSGSLFRAETFRDLADFLDDVALCDPGRLKYHGGHILNVLSHGEGILSYLNGRFRRKGLYFLDEPEAALSPASQIKFLKLLRRVVAGGLAQFIIATHSPILLAYPDAQIFSFEGDDIQEVAYEDTAHYRIYKQFFTDRSALL